LRNQQKPVPAEIVTHDDPTRIGPTVFRPAARAAARGQMAVVGPAHINTEACLLFKN